jgi:hypothetical protein
VERKLLAILLMLGAILRLWNYGAEGLGTIDAPVTIAQGLAFFYPGDQYPGLMMAQAPLGHFIIGLGCVLSGQDFSAVSEIPPISESHAAWFDSSIVRPYNAPEIISSLGEEIVAAEKFCLLPIYFFGMVFFLAGSVFAVALLGKRRGLYAVAFLAFNPFILFESRYFHVDIILYALVVLGLYFLWRGYSEGKDKPYFPLAFAFFGFSAATKFHAAAFFPLAIFVYLEKKRRIELGVIKMLSIYLAAFLLPFGFDPRKVVDVLRTYASIVPTGIYTPTIGLEFLKSLYSLFWYMGAFDVVMIFVSLYAFYRYRELGINQGERFILYYASLYFLVGFLLGSSLSPLRPLYLAFPLLIWVPLLISKGMDVLGGYAPVFIGIYAIVSFVLALQVSPYYELNTNPLLGSSEEYCWYSNVGEASKVIAEELSRIVDENDTYMLNYFNTASVHLYFRPEEYRSKSIFAEKVYNATGRPPLLAEIVKYYNFSDRWIRYVVLTPDVQYDVTTGSGREIKVAGRTEEPLEAFLRERCNPYRIVEVKGRAVAEIYDLANLTCG